MSLYYLDSFACTLYLFISLYLSSRFLFSLSILHSSLRIYSSIIYSPLPSSHPSFIPLLPFLTHICSSPPSSLLSPTPHSPLPSSLLSLIPLFPPLTHHPSPTPLLPPPPTLRWHEPIVDEIAHDEDVECSNMGVCVRASGQCACRPGFEVLITLDYFFLFFLNSVTHTRQSIQLLYVRLDLLSSLGLRYSPFWSSRRVVCRGLGLSRPFSPPFFSTPPWGREIQRLYYADFNPFFYLISLNFYYLYLLSISIIYLCYYRRELPASG